MVNICTYAMKATKQRLDCKADANETKSLSKLGRIFLEGTHQNKAWFNSWTSFIIFSCMSRSNKRTVVVHFCRSLYKL